MSQVKKCCRHCEVFPFIDETFGEQQANDGFCARFVIVRGNEIELLHDFELAEEGRPIMVGDYVITLGSVGCWSSNSRARVCEVFETDASRVRIHLACDSVFIVPIDSIVHLKRKY